MSIVAALRCAASIAALRRSVLTAASLASRSIRVHQSHHSLRSTSLRSIFARRFAPFSSMAERSDSDLLEVIKSEIKCAEECDEHDRVEEVPQGFPFDIEDEVGTNMVTLKRKFKGEEIEVTVSMPSIVTGEECCEGAVVSANDDADAAEIPTNNSIPITVYVTKGNGMGLEFTCTGYPDEVTIDSMSIRKNQESDEDMILYEGPDFTELDENLQRALHKYLEIRGITPLVTNFASGYMINKDSREYLYWLKNLEKFIQK